MATKSSSHGIANSEGFPKYTPAFEWKFYRSLVENYFAANAVSNDDQQKELFFAYLPTELINLVCGVIDTQGLPMMSMPKILDQLTEYFEKEVSVSVRRRNFYRRDRRELESVNDYATALKAQISCCNFGPETNALLCESFVLGLNHKRLQKMLCGCDCAEDFDCLVKRASLMSGVIAFPDGAGGIKGGGGDVRSELGASKEVAQRVDKVGEKLDYQIPLVDKDIGRIKALGVLEFFWCVTDFADKVKAASVDWRHQNMIYSEPFYTHRNGYRMRAALDLNCLNWILNKVCIHLHLEPGTYDEVLEWPVKKRVIVTFHGPAQTGRKAVFTDCFLAADDFPNPISAADYSNGGVRLPSTHVRVTFDSLQKFYVKDDKVFITILVVDS